MRTDDDPALRRGYARDVARAAGVEDPRIEDVFATIPREDFLPPPPWTTISGGVAARTSDVADIYANVLVALDRAQGINNGEPALHAAWLALVSPQPGEQAIHVGAGTGYYTAMLARLVGVEGRVEAYEIDQALAREAARNLESCPNVRVHADSALARDLPPADVIYVNAGVAAPDPAWLRALRPGGRLIFPWQPASLWGTAVLVRRTTGGFSAKPVMSVGFIACSGDGRPRAKQRPVPHADIRTRSVWLTADRPPDATATAVYGDVWFSSDAVDESTTR
jgi:protein-L-isoaspartate(D-aspartate) O-methyltransferase